MKPQYFYLLSVQHKWGGYGNTLVNGYACIDEETGVCKIQRTGPFIPPFTLHSETIVVTDGMRGKLDQSGLTGFTFLPVIKDKIVKLDWHKWNQESPYPREYPESGEAEDYIDARPHSPAAAEALGVLWAMKISELATVQKDPRIGYDPGAPRRRNYLVLATIDGRDFVRSPDVGWCFVSRRAREWLQRNVGEWVEFEEASIQ